MVIFHMAGGMRLCYTERKYIPIYLIESLADLFKRQTSRGWLILIIEDYSFDICRCACVLLI